MLKLKVWGGPLGAARHFVSASLPPIVPFAPPQGSLIQCVFLDENTKPLDLISKLNRC